MLLEWLLGLSAAIILASGGLAYIHTPQRFRDSLTVYGAVKGYDSSETNASAAYAALVMGMTSLITFAVWGIGTVIAVIVPGS